MSAAQSVLNVEHLAPRAGEVLVRVTSYAGCKPDIDPLPYVAAAGIAVQKPGESNFAESRVACIATPAETANHVVAREALTFAIPDGLDDASAARLLQYWPAAWYALHQQAKLQAGESVLVLDATHPVGTACVQLAKAAGAHVIALTRLRSEFRAARGSGADDVVSMQESLWPDIVREHGGADVIAGMVDADLFIRSMRSLARHGRLLAMKAPEMLAAELPVKPVLLRKGAIYGAFWSPNDEAETARPIFTALLALWTDGKIRAGAAH